MNPATIVVDTGEAGYVVDRILSVVSHRSGRKHHIDYLGFFNALMTNLRLKEINHMFYNAVDVFQPVQGFNNPVLQSTMQSVSDIQYAIHLTDVEKEMLLQHLELVLQHWLSYVNAVMFAKQTPETTGSYRYNYKAIQMLGSNYLSVTEDLAYIHSIMSPQDEYESSFPMPVFSVEF